MQTRNKILLLDTHVWLWLLNGDERIRFSDILRVLEKSGKQSAMRISIISLWEIGMLEAKGRITLPKDCFDWVEEALKAPGVLLEPISPEVAISSSRLPGDFYGDPADRILVATARTLDAVLVTADKRILKYSAKNYVQTLKV